MEVIGGIDAVLLDQFKPFRVARGNAFSRLHFFFTLVAPFVFAVAVGFLFGDRVANGAEIVIAVYAVLASVLTAVMPTIHGLIGPVNAAELEELNKGSVTSDENRKRSRQLIAKVEIVRSLYAAVAWAVIVLVASLLPLLALTASAFQSSDPPHSAQMDWPITLARGCFASVVAFAGATAVIALLQIVTGVHIMVRRSHERLEADLASIKARYGL